MGCESVGTCADSLLLADGMLRSGGTEGVTKSASELDVGAGTLAFVFRLGFASGERFRLRDLGTSGPV